MASPRHLARAPIVEAIFDVRTVLPPGSDPLTLRRLGEGQRDRYPVLEERHGLRTFFELGPGQAPRSGTQELGLEGVVLKTSDGLTQAQFRRDGFTLNRLRPYTAWETLLPEVERLWLIYLEGTTPDVVSRVAVRYINRLTLPFPLDDFRRYLTSPPGVPESVPQAVSAFLTRVTVVDPAHELAAHIVQALEPSASETAVEVILDIDAFGQRERGFAPEAILSTFEQLRELKNAIFFGSITETAVEMYA
ncbi:MAG: TIGR04255 family protein [Gemmatimonadota bacterium]